MEDQQSNLRSSDPYSGRRKIPTIPRFFRERKERAERKAKKKQAEAEPEETFDPITQRNVTVQDINYDYKAACENPKLVVPQQNEITQNGLPRQQPYISSTQPLTTYKQRQDDLAPPEALHQYTRDVPINDEKTNILFYPTPSVNLRFISDELRRKTNRYTFVCFIVAVLITWWSTRSRFASIVTPLIMSCAFYMWVQYVQQLGEQVQWGSEQARGEFSRFNLIPESAEWMNVLLESVWTLVNPELFSSFADQIEDVMQASVPSFIENIRIAALSQGENPIRIVSIRALPSDEYEKSMSDGDANAAKARELCEENVPGSRYYNLELCVAYHAKPKSDGNFAKRASNMHIEIIFYPGVRGTLRFPLPIWAEIKGFVTRLRLRIQLVPQVPFVKNITMSLMGLPQLDISAVPMVENGLNVLGLPVISNFVNNSIAAAANEYVCPKNITIDVSKIIVGDDVKKETNALGILFIHIDRAEGLSKQDVNGLSDAYITVTLSKYGKPLYCTRVVKHDLYPTWNEFAYILIFPEHIKAAEKVAMELWDSDRFTADDVVGRTKLDIIPLVQNAGTIYEREDGLVGLDEDTKLPGKLFWKVGYIPKANFKSSLRTKGLNISVPRELRQQPEFENPKGSLSSKEEEAAVTTALDPEYPSGIFAFTLHQAANLEVNRPVATYGKIKGAHSYEAPRETGAATAEEGKGLPSSYVCVDINDELVYKTRTKVFSSQPIYNAGSEKFVADWRSAMITFTVREYRLREQDPILGVVCIPLAKTLETASQLTKWFPIEGGMGFGNLRVSILFRSLKFQIPRPLYGWNIGTFVFESPTIEGVSDDISSISYSQLRFYVGSFKGKAKLDHDSSSENCRWTVGQRYLKVPVRQRFKTPVSFELRSGVGNRSKIYGIFWLMTLLDNESSEIEVPLFTVKDPRRILQNMVDIETAEQTMGVKVRGYLRMKVCFTRGLSDVHEQTLTTSDEFKTYETFTALKGQKMRQDFVNDMTNPVQEYFSKSRRQSVASNFTASSNDTFASPVHQQNLQPANANLLQQTTYQNGDSNLANELTELGTLYQVPDASAEKHQESPKVQHNLNPQAPANRASNVPSGDALNDANARRSETSPSNTNHSIDEDMDTDVSFESENERISDGSVYRHEDDLSVQRRLHRGRYSHKSVRTSLWLRDGLKLHWHSFKRLFSLAGDQPDVETEIPK
ncbi:C2 domain-containing protein [Schizosaccharomyces japonicus yFS275]|uniref:C2 domain-containing protein n=1 Tax=Schizosaccharomyces japonicus (strain yFS275 / FY16936) TaxID=402676 RepID=B6K6S8_SCHJY|nr:C2 domain-containing protein [Schizosaccharomyces japonicus yFS275]EEB09232.1 C2 domain-containing protein [Schizosaccharomyces japonicus yFS275]